MDTADHSALCEQIDQFITGRDRSIAQANRIEGLLIRDYAESEVFEPLTELLALYNPGWKAPYVGEEELTARLREVARELCGPRSS